MSQLIVAIRSAVVRLFVAISPITAYNSTYAELACRMHAVENSTPCSTVSNFSGKFVIIIIGGRYSKLRQVGGGTSRRAWRKSPTGITNFA